MTPWNVSTNWIVKDPVHLFNYSTIFFLHASHYCYHCHVLCSEEVADLRVNWPQGRSERKSIRASRYESRLRIWWKVQSVFHAHTHLTSAWNVVGAGAAKRMENGVRKGKGGRRGGGAQRGKRSVEGEWVGGEAEREQSDGHRDYNPGDDRLKSEDLE